MILQLYDNFRTTRNTPFQLYRPTLKTLLIDEHSLSYTNHYKESKAKMREKSAETRVMTNVGCKEGECPMAKPANHDPSATIAEVVVPVPVIIPGPFSEAEPYAMSPPDPLDVEPYVMSPPEVPLDVEPIGSDPDDPGGVTVVVTGSVVTGVVVTGVADF